jgi:hypothetical protein
MLRLRLKAVDRWGPSLSPNNHNFLTSLIFCYTSSNKKSVVKKRPTLTLSSNLSLTLTLTLTVGGGA